MQDWKLSRRAFAVIAAAPVTWLILFFLVPMTIVWGYSFGRNTSITTIEFSGTISNYARAIEPLYLGIFLKSVLVAALTTLICFVVGFPVAMAIAFSRERWKAWLLLLIMLPFWTNLLIRTYALLSLLGQRGFANGALEQIWNGGSGLSALLGFGRFTAFEPVPLLYNDFALILGLVYVHLPFMVLPLYAALDRLDKSLIEASLDLGAGHWKTITRIVIPLAAPGILSGLLITFVPALGAYLTPDLMGGTDSQMIANVIERQFKRANDWPFGAALSFVLMYATFILIALQALRNKRSEART
ncbi:ABC transporter permease [Sphingomonas sp.]|uniref:ABC transporter permease n=1 Tax=Sphingomonas sp. TaxID=28214 RepID=UPI00286EA9A6|nr:ABC transporter permease [Sphingomonas sp.]